MPAMASITVKKLDTVTDVIYDAVTGSPGDTGLALWRQDTGQPAALPLGHRAWLSFATRFNGPRTARRFIGQYVMPYTVLNASTGRYEAKDRIVFDLSGVMPQEIPVTFLSEGAYQGLNLFGSLLIKQAAASGYAPN